MNDSLVWNSIDYSVAKALYESRYKIYQTLLKAFQGNDTHGYVELALGIKNRGGNYSAAEYGLGPKILNQSSPQRVFQMAEKLYACNDPKQILDIIYKESIPNLKVSVGSEMAALLKPDLFWVVNARTIWAHFVIEKKKVESANLILSAYHEDMPSDMEYNKWKQIYPFVGPSMTTLASIGADIAKLNGITPGIIKFLWADAIADTAYNKYSKVRVSKWSVYR
jgi:hypothetical protein